MDSNSTSRAAASHGCKICGKEFPTKPGLTRHQQTHLPKTEFECSLCDYTTNVKNSLALHIRSHTKERPYKCRHPNCEAAFMRPSHLRDHQLVHQKEDDSLAKFRCLECPYKTVFPGRLKRHGLIHSNVKAFSCELCPYRAKYKSHIKIHVQNVHLTVEPKIKCPEQECDYVCKSRSALNKHAKVHEVDKPWVCPWVNCPFTTKWRYKLKSHEMDHRGEKAFQCTLCEFAANQSYGLVAHMRKHTGEAPYPCPNCAYCGKTSGKLSRHIQACRMGKSRAGGKTRRAI